MASPDGWWNRALRRWRASADGDRRKVCLIDGTLRAASSKPVAQAHAERKFRCQSAEVCLRAYADNVLVRLKRL